MKKYIIYLIFILAEMLPGQIRMSDFSTVSVLSDADFFIMLQGTANRKMTVTKLKNSLGAVWTTGTYANPTWITSLSGSKIISGTLNGDALINGTVRTSKIQNKAITLGLLNQSVIDYIDSRGGGTVTYNGGYVPLDNIHHLSPTTGERILCKESGANYVVRDLPIPNFHDDGISLIETGNHKYAYIEPVGGKYIFSQFQTSSGDDAADLQNALDYIYRRNNVMSNYNYNGNDLGGDITVSTPNVLYIDKTITLRDSIHLWTDQILESDFQGIGSANIINVDMNDTTKTLITFRNGWAGSYNSAQLKNLYFKFKSSALNAFWFFRPMGVTLDNVCVDGNGFVANGIVMSQMTFSTMQHVQINDVTGYGVLIPALGNYPQPYAWINTHSGQWWASTTTTLLDVNVSRGNIGYKIEKNAIIDLQLRDFCVQQTDSSAVVVDGGTHINIDNLYTEAIPKIYSGTTKTGNPNIPILKFGTYSGGSYYSLGMYNVSNSNIYGNMSGGSPFGLGIEVNWATELNVSNTFFQSLANILTTDTNTCLVNWNNNHEGSGGKLMRAMDKVYPWSDASLSSFGIADSSRININSGNFSPDFTDYGTHSFLTGGWYKNLSKPRTRFVNPVIKYPTLTLNNATPYTAGTLKYENGNASVYNGTSWDLLNNPPQKYIYSGTATITGSYIDVTHGCGAVPDTDKISISTIGAGVASVPYVSDIGSLTFRINGSPGKYSWQIFSKEVLGADLFAAHNNFTTGGWTVFEHGSIDASNIFSVPGSGWNGTVKNNDIGLVAGLRYKMHINYTVTGNYNLTIYDNYYHSVYNTGCCDGTYDKTIYFVAYDKGVSFYLINHAGTDAGTFTINSCTIQNVQ